MSTGENQSVARHWADAFNDSIGPFRYLLGRLAVRAAVTKKLPIRTFGENIFCQTALVFPVVPFDKILVDSGGRTKARQLACTHGSAQRAGVHLVEFQSAEPPPDQTRVVFSLFRQGQVGEPGMLTGYAPCRLAMSGEVNSGEHFVHNLMLIVTEIRQRV